MVDYGGRWLWIGGWWMYGLLGFDVGCVWPVACGCGLWVVVETRGFSWTEKTRVPWFTQ